jgi:transcriptional regulator with XRE-family HTH domain
MTRTATRQNGAEIRHQRRVRGIATGVMAAKLDIARSTLVGVENGSGQASWELLGRIREVLDVPLDSLLTEAGKHEFAEMQREAVASR